MLHKGRERKRDTCKYRKKIEAKIETDIVHAKRLLRYTKAVSTRKISSAGSLGRFLPTAIVSTSCGYVISMIECRTGGRASRRACVVWCSVGRTSQPTSQYETNDSRQIRSTSSNPCRGGAEKREKKKQKRKKTGWVIKKNDSCIQQLPVDPAISITKSTKCKKSENDDTQPFFSVQRSCRKFLKRLVEKPSNNLFEVEPKKLLIEIFWKCGLLDETFLRLKKL